MSGSGTKSTEAQSDMLLWIGAGAVGSIALVWLVVSQFGASGANETLAATAEVPAVPVAILEGSATTSDLTETAGESSPMGAALDNPLRAAQMAYEAGMLTEPADYSAWTLFSAALSSDPRSEAARQGLEKVAGDLLTRGTSAVEQGRYSDAATIANQILEKLPEHDGAALLKQAIADGESRQRARESARVAAPAIRVDQAGVSNSSISAPQVNRNSAETAPARAQRNPDEMLNEYQNGFEAAVANNQLLAPADDSAKHFVLEMRQMDSNDDRTKAAAHWLITEMIGRSRQATEATDWASSETWIDEAEALGASTAMLLEARTFQIDQMAAAESAKRLPASELKLVKFVQADYPRTAVSRNMEGWVDLDFRVTSGGRTDDIVVTDASHSRLFQTEAIEAVEQWTFEPREFMGRRIDQNVYTRVRFVIAQ